GYARFYLLEVTVVGGHLHDLVDEELPLGPGANQAHIALEHVEELRNFVEPQFPHEPPHTRNPRVALAGELRPLGFGIGEHRPEFVDVKGLVVPPNALLLEDDGPR